MLQTEDLARVISGDPRNEAWTKKKRKKKTCKVESGEVNSIKSELKVLGRDPAPAFYRAADVLCRLVWEVHSFIPSNEETEA